MFNSAILDIAIGMVLLYVLISLLCSAINELISQLLKMRAKNLEEGLVNLLHSKEGNTLVAEVYKHPLISGLSKKDGNIKRPSYIPAKTFTLALIDVMTGSTGKPPTDNTALLKAFEEGPYAQTDAAKSIMLLLNEAKNDANKARENLENWYNDAMDRVGGWYKQKTQLMIFAISLMICFALNVDSIQISQTLWTDTAMRQALVQVASSQNTIDSLAQSVNSGKTLTAEESDEPSATEMKHSVEHASTYFNKINELSLPIGWQDKNGKSSTADFKFLDWLTKLMGILITAIAASLGAPFWFQLLNKVVDLRAAGKQPVRTLATDSSGSQKET